MPVCWENIVGMLRKKNYRKKTIFQNRIMIFPLIFVIGGLFLISNDMGIVKWYQLRKERNQIQAEIDFKRRPETLSVQEFVKLLNGR